MGLAGAAFQKVLLGIEDSGLASDVQTVTRVARMMVEKVAMSERIGTLCIDPARISDKTRQTVDEEIARQFGLQDHKGALVRRLADGPLGEQSPARAAGLRAGDVIQRWNGHSVDSAGGLIARVSQTQVGETVPVVVLREGAAVQLNVTVGQRPAHLQ